jgi:hypothetical protein
MTETKKAPAKKETAAKTESGPTYKTGSVNVDSLKEILTELSAIFPFQDETSKKAFEDRISSIHESGNPRGDEEEEAAA